MRKFENDCVGCDSCYNCGRKKTLHFYCDKCGYECEIRELDGEELCVDCLIKKIPIVEE